MFNNLFDKNKYKDLNDFELIKINSKKSITELYLRYVDSLYKYCFYKTGLQEVAEDITGDVFVSVFENLDNFKFNSSFKTYLFGICKNKLVEYYKRKYKESTSFVLDQFSDSEDVLETVNFSIENERDELLKIIKSLNEVEKSIILKRYENQQKFKDIADDLDMSLSNVKVTHYRAIKKLKELYKVKI